LKLEQQLQQIRSRYGWQLFLRTLLLNVAIACGVTGLSWFAAAFNSRSFAPLLLFAVLLAAGLLLSALVAWRLTPSLQQTARLLENQRHLGLSERLSTALEIKLHGKRSALHHALIEDADSIATTLQPRELVALHLPRPLLVLFAASAALLVAAVFLTGPLAGRQAAVQGAAVHDAATGVAAPELTVEERAALAGDLQRIAEVFTQQAEESRDPYLQAISRELQEISRQLDGQGLSRPELSSRLEQLLDHTRSALQSDQSEAASSTTASTSPHLPELLEAALRELNPDAAADMHAEYNAGEPDETAEANADADRPDAATAASGAAQQLSLEELLAGQRAEYDGPADSTEAGGKPGDGYTSAADLDAAALRELDGRAQAAQQAAGEVIGASADSTKGASSLAGAGTQELFGDEQASAQAGETEQVVLPDAADPEGRHTRIEAAPDVTATEVFETPLGAVSWVRNGEPAVSREPITPALRRITARYHSPEGERR
jgi:hypothetical protein